MYFFFLNYVVGLFMNYLLFFCNNTNFVINSFKLDISNSNLKAAKTRIINTNSRDVLLLINLQKEKLQYKIDKAKFFNERKINEQKKLEETLAKQSLKTSKTKETLTGIYEEFLKKAESNSNIRNYIQSIRYNLEKQIHLYTNELVENNFKRYLILF